MTTRESKSSASDDSLSPTQAPLKELATWLKAEMERCDDKALIHQDGTEHQRRNQLIGDDDLRQNQQIRLHWAGKKAAFAEVLEAVVSALSPHPPTSETCICNPAENIYCALHYPSHPPSEEQLPALQFRCVDAVHVFIPRVQGPQGHCQCGLWNLTVSERVASAVSPGTPTKEE